MHAVVRSYSGQGAGELFDVIEQNTGEIEDLIRAVPGFVSYTIFRTGVGGISVTVCMDKAGTDESSRVAAEWIKGHMTGPIDPPTISEGSTILQLS
jgi:hypothetical protein